MRNLTLLTDLYQITMGYGFYQHGKHEEEVVFDLFFRRNKMITYSIAAGLEQAMDYLLNWNVTDDDVEYLRSLKLFSEDFLEYFKNMKFIITQMLVDLGRIAVAQFPAQNTAFHIRFPRFDIPGLGKK